MATRGAERALLDTNILLAATDEGRRQHHAAREALTRWPADGTSLYTCGQVLREYLVVTTRPATANGLGMSREDAIANVRALRLRLRLLPETEKVADQLLLLLDDVNCSGKQIHDANLVAVMVTHGVDTIATLNAADFRRFGDRINVIDLDPAR